MGRYPIKEVARSLGIRNCLLLLVPMTGHKESHFIIYQCFRVFIHCFVVQAALTLVRFLSGEYRLQFCVA